jgi:hypothetical protein
MFLPNGGYLLNTEGVGLDIYDFIVGFIHHDCRTDCNVNHDQEAFNFDKPQKIIQV